MGIYLVWLKLHYASKGASVVKLNLNKYFMYFIVDTTLP